MTLVKLVVKSQMTLLHSVIKTCCTVVRRFEVKRYCISMISGLGVLVGGCLFKCRKIAFGPLEKSICQHHPSSSNPNATFDVDAPITLCPQAESSVSYFGSTKLLGLSRARMGRPSAPGLRSHHTPRVVPCEYKHIRETGGTLRAL